eukprot:SAG22_NODE_5019_length_1106_cov_0.985104_1_plen_291_part_00
MIIACDGIWDEMSSDEAVHLCHHLFTKHEANPEANIADEFLDETLKKAVERLRRTDPDEEEMTLADLKARPCGKQGRSQLHDDLTCVVLRWTSTAGKALKAKFGGASGWTQIKKAVDMHRQIKHRKQLKWTRLMEDLMVVVRAEREGAPSVLTTRILSEADDDDDDDGGGGGGGGGGAVGAQSAQVSKMLGGGGADFTVAVAMAAKAAEDAAKAATSAGLAGQSANPSVVQAAMVAANAAASAANQAAAAAAAAATAATSAARACEVMARACGLDVSALTGAQDLEEAKD